MKKYTEPYFEILQLEILDILTASTDRGDWDLLTDDIDWE